MEKYITKECNTHGLVEFVLEGRGYYRCKKCRSEQVQKRRDKLKLMAVEYLGGCCSRCGYSKSVKALQFHHKDPTQKEFGIAYKGYTRSWEAVKTELDKCELVCANCHAELHAEE